MVARQIDGTVRSDIDNNLQGPKINLHARFGCSALDGLGGVCEQRNKHTDGNFMHCSKMGPYGK